MIHHWDERNAKAYSLIEVLIAVCILALLAFFCMTALEFSWQTTRVNSQAFAARNLAQGYIERMSIDTFANVGPTTYTNITYASNPPVYLDTALKIPAQVQFVFTGYGTASSGGTTSLTDSSASWTSGQWVGNTVYLVWGSGAGQFVQISANSSNTLTFSQALTYAPAAGTLYMINNGKTVQVTVTWQYQGTTCPSQTVQGLIVNYHNYPKLGFGGH